MSETTTVTQTWTDNTDFWDYWKKEYGPTYVPTPYYPTNPWPQPCPGCGRCPVCGRGVYWPSYPYTWSL